MAANIWGIAESWRGEISEATYELLTLGRELADATGAVLETVLAGAGVKSLAGVLGAADKVLVAENPALAEPPTETHASALAQLVRARKPACVLVPLTNVSWDWVGMLPALLDMPFLNFCEDVRFADGRFEVRCLLYGGKMQARVAATSPVVLGILPGARHPAQGRVEKLPPVEEVTIELAESPRVVFKLYIEPEKGDVDIRQQPVLVAVGRGIQTQDNVALAQELADALGGALCGSRPVIDQGWLPLSRQVGKSGATVKPKLYLALGISGAPEHVEGMKNSELIIAINSDPQAPIFNVAHYGVVGDALKLAPALAETLRARKV